MSAKPGIYGLIAEFDKSEDLIHAVEHTRREGYQKIDAYSPFPIEELSHAMGLHHTKLPFIVLIGGVLGCLGGYFMQYYAAVVDYPINIGGRPMNSWPAFIPVTFETTILCAAFAAVLGMLALNGLPMPYHPVFNVESFERASSDRFFLCIQAQDPRFDQERTRRFLADLKALRVSEVPH
jgi:hypothetical protein